MRSRPASSAKSASASSRFDCLQLGDLLLDGVPRDQPIGEHVARLADPVRAIDRLRLDRGVPPRIEQEHVVRRRQVEPEPAGLRLIRNSRQSGSDWNRATALGAIARPAVEVFVGDAARRRARPRSSAEQGRELREDQRLVPFLDAPRAAAAAARRTSRTARRCVPRRPAPDGTPPGAAAAAPRAPASSTAACPRCCDAREQRLPVVRRAARRRSWRCGGSSSQWIVCSDARGSSGATCSLVRRRMNGRSAARRAARASASSGSRRRRRARAERGRRCRASPGFRNSNRLHSSPRWFSIGVPLSASR